MRGMNLHFSVLSALLGESTFLVIDYMGFMREADCVRPDEPMTQSHNHVIVHSLTFSIPYVNDFGIWVTVLNSSGAGGVAACTVYF